MQEWQFCQARFRNLTLRISRAAYELSRSTAALPGVGLNAVVSQGRLL